MFHIFSYLAQVSTVIWFKFNSVLNLDTMDSTGEQKIDVSQQIYKTRIDSTGSPISATRRDDGNPSKGQVVTKDPDYCGSCYGAESETRKCCNTCKEIQLAYQERHWVVKNLSVFEQCREEQWDDTLANLGSEGCRIQGSLQVNKVAGSFHITPGNSYASDQVHVHNLQGFDGQKLNMSHKIDKLAFGNMYPGQTNPLDGTTMNVVEPAQMVTYYMKLVPTMYVSYNTTTRSLSTVHTNQYSVTWHSKGSPLTSDSSGIPGLFFNYELSPLLVKISYEHKSFLHFLTNTCAIIGGVFTVASLLDAFIYQSTCVVRKRLSTKHSS
ncbi:endoplasmic reticulum-Golgi intermediate compartment protein 3 [Clonorchis sinensis]|uniref:Endoplasmic reticulum-Golgi intermediate compartment protein 3 n=1 Tax=Clonorchis sinensis TaxID=79923 RepID=G7YK52_CLOSI|nr:endoplasmic reticulum-Golgi intermediate compartment protein 3 [Clonorchis sinensis]